MAPIQYDPRQLGDRSKVLIERHGLLHVCIVGNFFSGEDSLVYAHLHDEALLVLKTDPIMKRHRVGDTV
jgi:hypothetical protein